MIFVVRKIDKKTYHVKNKFSGVVKAERRSYTAAQEVANDLNRRQQSEGAEFVHARAEAPRRGDVHS